MHPPRLLPCALLTTILASSGCITPWNTRLPQLGWDEPGRARVDQERFDAYPLPDLGPDTYSRQRDMATPRPMPRRTNDQLLNSKFGVPGTEPQAEASYNQIVK